MFGIDDAIAAGLKVLDKFIDDPNKRAEAAHALNMALVGLDAGQQQVNKAEAAHGSVFVAGWRPAIGWTCAIALFTYYVPYVLTATALWAWQVIQSGRLLDRPDLGVADLIGLVFAMLGMSTLRTVEKRDGTAAAGVAGSGGLIGMAKRFIGGG
jgi:hypothetical protein